MFRSSLFIALLSGTSLIASNAYSAPKFSSGTSVGGVLAYQDSEDNSQFHYLPLFTDVVLGPRLKTFKTTHYGIGRAYFVQSATGEITSRAGAIVSGSAVIDISDEQRAKLIEQINKDFQVANPKLLPLAITESKITSSMLDKALSFNEGLEVELPTGLTIGSEFTFSVGSQNSGFGHLAAARQQGGDIQANPHFGMNVIAKAEFQGDPWRAVIDCDLTSVWKQTRTKFGGSVSAGWFRIGSASYSKIAQELKDSGACTFDMKEGSLDTAAYGRQVLDMTKKIFEAINKLATEGDGFFKFDTNYPQAEVPSGGGGGNLFGFSVSINVGHSEAEFNQERKWHEEVSYTGRFTAPVALSAVLAVNCGSETKKMFQDLNDASEPCVTQEKADLLSTRLKREGAAKTKKYEELVQKLVDGKITPEVYDKLKAVYDRMSLTEFVAGVVNLNIKQAGVEAKKVDALVFGLPPGTLEQIEKDAIKAN
ncbi:MULTISPECIES: hypothetical protein [Rhizobium]|uniref:hypothetical protein n=1 Tax=Rhizobium phaseoli TaxID=396 RepID=UPI000A1D8438|nr:hypothetical protein [Rhizobium phaseoli]